MSWARSVSECSDKLSGEAEDAFLDLLDSTKDQMEDKAELLAACKRGQLWVGTSRSDLFDVDALATALGDGRIEACILDGAEGSFLGDSSPLKGLKNLFITPRLSSHTREARLRSSWYVAHRMHEAIGTEQTGRDPLASAPVNLEIAGATLPSQWTEPDFVIH